MSKSSETRKRGKIFLLKEFGLSPDKERLKVSTFLTKGESVAKKPGWFFRNIKIDNVGTTMGEPRIHLLCEDEADGDYFHHLSIPLSHVKELLNNGCLKTEINKKGEKIISLRFYVNGESAKFKDGRNPGTPCFDKYLQSKKDE